MPKPLHPRAARQRSLGASLARAIERDDGPDAVHWIKAAGGDLSDMERNGEAPSDLALRLGAGRAFDSILRHGRWTPRGLVGLFVSAIRSESLPLSPQAWTLALEARSQCPNMLLNFLYLLRSACAESGKPLFLPFAFDGTKALHASTTELKARALFTAIDLGYELMLNALLACGAFEACSQNSPSPAQRACVAWIQFEISLNSKMNMYLPHLWATKDRLAAFFSRYEIVLLLFQKMENSWPAELASNEFEACSKLLRLAPVPAGSTWSAREIAGMARFADDRAIHLSAGPAHVAQARMRI